ncbi:MAG: septum formation initiator family protein [Actinomycetales bacterium]|nr:septum formation initiator family protein [Actinomycetales bacterium]
MVALIVVLAALAVTLAIPVRAWLTQRAEISALEADVAAAQIRVADLQQELEDWNDPAFVIAQARSRLHFVFPGEVGYVVLGSDDRPVTPDTTAAQRPVPWYEQLWESTRQADLAGAPSP